eukprot:gene42513-56505_t
MPMAPPVKERLRLTTRRISTRAMVEMARAKIPVTNAANAISSSTELI